MAVELSDVDDATLWWVGGVAAVGCVVAAALVRRPWGLWSGSVMQVLVLAAGVALAVPAMLFLAAVFAVLWFLTVHLGLKLERLQAERRAQRPPPGT